MLSAAADIARFDACAEPITAVEWLDGEGRGCRREQAAMGRLFKRLPHGGRITVRLDVADVAARIPVANAGQETST
jgi:hypothetical protein